MGSQNGELAGDDPGRKGSKRRAFMSTNGDRPLKGAQMGILSNSRRLKDVPVPRRRSDRGKEAELDHIVLARDVENVVVLPLV